MSSLIHRISTQTDMSMQTQSRMNESLSNEAQSQEICPHHEWIQQTKVQMLRMIDRWCPQPLMNQHFLIQTGSGAAASTRVPSFAGSETEREAEPANTHDLIRRVGLLSCWEQDEQEENSAAESRTFNPPNMIQSSLCNTYVIERSKYSANNNKKSRCNIQYK